MPFDSDQEQKAPVRKVGVKQVNITQPSVNNAETKTLFEKKADEQMSKIENYKTQIWDLSIKYKSFVENKVLQQNKGPIAINLENETLDKLVQLAEEMNEDSTQPEGIGSNALCMVLLKCMLIQRNSINELHYKIEQLNKKLPKNES